MIVVVQALLTGGGMTMVPRARGYSRSQVPVAGQFRHRRIVWAS